MHFKLLLDESMSKLSDFKLLLDELMSKLSDLYYHSDVSVVIAG